MGGEKKLGKEAIFVILLSLTFVIFLSSVTSAAVIVTFPTNGSNNSATTFFNVTYINETDITNALNATFYYNGTLLGNTSGCEVNSCAATIDTSGLPNGVFSINATIWNGSTNVNVSTGVALSVVFDNINPKANASNFTAITSGNNYSSSLVLNISVIDTETGINTTSGVQTVYFNITLQNGTQNLTFTQFSATNVAGINWNYTIDTTWFNDGVYNITAWTTDYAGNQNNSAVINTVYFDNTNPLVQAANFSGFTTGSNKSAMLSLNVTLIDALTGFETVYFNITLVNGTQNATFTQLAATNVAGNSWNYTIDTTWFNDGVYNVSVWTNDTAGNQNNTAYVNNVTFDNTLPTITFSCSPSSVVQGNVVTCTCSDSDATSGVETKTVTTPSTFSSGPHTETCSVTDYSGNSFSKTATFNVEGIGGGGSSSGGSSGGSSGSSTPLITGTTILVESQITNGYTARFEETGKIQVDFQTSSGTSSTHSVQVTSITNQGVTIVVQSDPVTINLLVGQTKKIDVDNDNIFDLSVKLNSIISGKANLTIKQIEEPVPEPQLQPEESAKSDTVVDTIKGTEAGTGEKSNTLLIVIVVVILIIIIVAIVYFIRKKRLANAVSPLRSRRKK